MKKKKWLVITISLFFLIGFSFFLLVKLSHQLIKGSSLALSLLTADTSSLKSNNNRVNFLILGISGGQHEGSDLTDTIIFSSIDKKTADTAMFSLPRDIWLNSLQAKINSAYHYGEENKPGEGFKLAKQAVEEVIGQPINYSVLIDFDGFVKVVDLLGGVKVKVDRSFDDFQYPIKGKENDNCQGDEEYKCRYEHLHFEAGEQIMDGKTALKFVRSRHAKGEEGTDFSRSQRQRKVILALKDKLFSLKLILNPQKIMEIKKTLGKHLKFDYQFNEKETTAFISLFLRFVKNKNQLRTISLDSGDEDNLGFLYNPPLEKYGQWVLIPRAGAWSEIHKYIKEKIYQGY